MNLSLSLVKHLPSEQNECFLLLICMYDFNVELIRACYLNNLHQHLLSLKEKQIIYRSQIRVIHLDWEQLADLSFRENLRGFQKTKKWGDLQKDNFFLFYFFIFLSFSSWLVIKIFKNRITNWTLQHKPAASKSNPLGVVVAHGYGNCLRTGRSRAQSLDWTNFWPQDLIIVIYCGLLTKSRFCRLPEQKADLIIKNTKLWQNLTRDSSDDCKIH